MSDNKLNISKLKEINHLVIELAKNLSKYTDIVNKDCKTLELLSKEDDVERIDKLIYLSTLQDLQSSLYDIKFLSENNIMKVDKIVIATLTPEEINKQGDELEL